MGDALEGIKRGFGKRAFATGKIALSAARLAARGVVGASGATDGVIGQAMARELDQMKGMAMKVGQILSYFDGVLPEETHAALQSLQRGARPVAFETMGAVVQEAFGEPAQALFEEFDEQPVAAASIGQVYRARYLGQPVAVKVQYPGVAETIDADFKRLGKLARLASLASAVDGVAIAEELRQSIGEECDYRREAAYQDAFAQVWDHDPAVLIPRSVPARTAEKVITTQWCEGRDFYTFVAEASQERKNEVAQLLARFAYRSMFGRGTINADPHPGNYLFPRNGPVVFLDFGCVRRIDTEFLEVERRLAQVVVEDRRSEFDEALLATRMVVNEARFDFDFHWKMLCHQYEPYRSPSYHFTFDYMKRGMEFSGHKNPNMRRLSIPPPWIWLTRLQWGLHAVMARLDARGCYSELMREELARPLEPMVLPEFSTPTD